MNKLEVSTCFELPMEEIERFEQAGLLDRIAKQNGELNFENKDITYLSHLVSLKQIGLSFNEIKQYVSFEQHNQINQQRQFLSKKRNDILHDIHTCQKQLDIIDMIIYEFSSYKRDDFNI